MLPLRCCSHSHRTLALRKHCLLLHGPSQPSVSTPAAQHGHRFRLRRHFSQSSHSNNDDNGKAAGTRWIQAGAFLMGLVVLEEAYGRYQDHVIQAEFQATVAQLQQDANAKIQTAAADNPQYDYANMPALKECQVIQTHASLDGTNMLYPVQHGDQVQVLVMDVGPDQAYHMCRGSVQPNSPATSTATTTNGVQNKHGKNVGWYPKEFLKEFEA